MIISNTFKKNLFIVSSLVFTSVTYAAATAADETTAKTAAPVVVTATRFASSIDTAPVNVTVISAEDIANSGAQNLSDVLKSQAALHVTDLFGISGSKAKVDMGGFGQAGGQNTLVLLNGRRLNDVDLQGTNFAAIPLASIAKIEIIHGSSTVLYGDNAVSGVINIVTKNGFDGTQLGASQTTGSFLTQGLSANLSLARGDNAYSLVIDKMKSNGYRNNSAFNTTSMIGEYNREHDNWNFGARLNASTEKLELPGALNEPLFKANPHQSTATIEHAQERRTTVEGFVLNDRFSAELAVRNKHQEATIFGDSEADLRTVSFTPRMNFRFGPHTLIAGIDTYFSSMDSRAIFGGTFPAENASDTTRNSVAEYVSADIALGNATALNMGLRNQHVEFDLKNTNLLSSAISKDNDDQTLTAWDISLSHNHNYGARGYVRVAKSFRFPVLDETWSYFTGDITLLKPQTGRHIEIGTRHRLGNGMLYSIDLFRIKLSDEIGYDSASFTNVNFDDTVHRGGNFKLRVPVDKRLDLQASATYRKAYFSSGPNNGKTVPLVPGKSLTASAQFHLPANNNIGVDAVHTGTRYFSDDLSNAGKRMPAYTRLDLHYDHRFSNIKLKAAIKNITNTSQADFGLYNPFAANPYFYYPLPERAVYFTVEGEL